MRESAHSEASTTVLDVKNLKTYFFMEKSTVRAVDGVSLKLERNKTLGLVGESGCGKSVTALSIMRLIQSPPGEIVEGEILLHRNGEGGEVDIVTLDPRGSRMRKIRGEEIAMVFQEPMTSLNPLYTVGEQIAETVRLHQEVGREEGMARALDMLHQVRISGPKQRLHEYPHQLSGGMRQRVMIAMALSCNPSILIADEPTTALDVTVQAQILDLMRELQDEFGSGIIMITHNLGVISQIADDVAVMYLGKIVEYSDVRTVFHNPHHPYTVGLLNSVPVFGRGGEKVLVPIEGMVPTPTEEIQGCAFAPRCPRARGICTKREPPLREVEAGHYAACWPE
jgi:oligopeptide/dipeptide ABC transporter ATP-binding protein